MGGDPSSGALAQVAMLGPQDTYLDAPAVYAPGFGFSYAPSHLPVAVAIPVTPARLFSTSYIAVSSDPLSMAPAGSTTSRNLAPHPMTVAEYGRYLAAASAAAQKSSRLDLLQSAQTKRAAGMVLVGGGVAALCLVIAMAVYHKRGKNN